MAFIPLPSGIKMIYHYTKDQQQCINVQYATIQVPGQTMGTYLSGAIAAMAAWWAVLRTVIGSQTVVTAFEAADWSSPVGAVSIDTTITGASGAVTTTPVPNNVSLAVTLLTLERGRSQRGRNYIVGLGANNIINQNQVNSATATAILNAYTALGSSLLANDLAPVVASFFTNGAPRVTGRAVIISGHRVENICDSQRRRLPGRGT